MRFTLLLAFIGALLIVAAFLPAQAYDGGGWSEPRSVDERNEQHIRAH